MNLDYCRTLQKAWNNFGDLSSRTKPRPHSNAKHTNESKVKHLEAFMKKQGRIAEYEDSVGLSRGMITQFTKWLLIGKLGNCDKALIKYYTDRVNNNPMRRRAKK